MKLPILASFLSRRLDAAPPVYDSVCTALGYAAWDLGGFFTIAASRTYAAGDLVVVGVREGVGSGEVATYTPELGAGGPAFTQVAARGHNGGIMLYMFAALCTVPVTAALTVAVTVEGMAPEAATGWASAFTNISSATPSPAASVGLGTSGTVYSTTTTSTTVKTVQVGYVSKFSGSTGTWQAEWTNGQGVTNSWSEGYKLNRAAASGQQTYKSSGLSAAWSALWAAFPVRTS